MKKIIKLTESDLARIVKRVLNEQTVDSGDEQTVASGDEYDIEDCVQDVFGGFNVKRDILPKIPSCVWLAKYHKNIKKGKFDKNDKYDKVKVPACRTELEALSKNSGHIGAVYIYPEVMNCLLYCINCFDKQSIAKF